MITDIAKVSRTQINILAVLILGMAVFVRFYNVPYWLLANVDEISTINQQSIPFLDTFSGASTSTNYLLTTIILKTLGRLIHFPYLRYFTGLINIIALVLVYRVLKKIFNPTVGFFALILLSFSWVTIYISRLFECASFTPSFACFFMCCMLIWINDRRKVKWLYFAVFLLGFHLNTYAMPSFYTVALFLLYLLVQAIHRTLSLKILIFVSLILIVSASPYIYSFVSSADFSSDISISYGTLGQPPVLQPAVNFSKPLYYLKTLAEYLTFYPISNKSFARFGFAFIAIILPLVVLVGHRPKGFKLYLGFVAFGSLILIGLSPIPVYNEGHLQFFWPHYVVLLVLLIYESWGGLKMVLGVLYCLILLANLIWIPHIFQNQVGQVEDVLTRHLQDEETIYISDGALLKLRPLHLFSIIERHNYQMYVCQGPDAINLLKNTNIRERSMVIMTSDCPEIEHSFKKVDHVTLLLSIEQMLEANFKHGLRIYEIRPGP